MYILSFLTSLIPLAISLVLYFAKNISKKLNKILCILPLVVSLIANIIISFAGKIDPLVLFKVSEDLLIVAFIDTMSKFFAILISVVMLIVTIYSFEYFKDDEKKNRFDSFFLLSYAALMMLTYSGNLVTMYISFEMVTLFSMPLVLHEKTKESIDAALKYLIYSVGGAFLGFIGIVYLSSYSGNFFVLGGSLAVSSINQNILNVVLLLMLIGFGTKCGMFPLHNWLPTAHPVAPAPASSILSGIITKSGIIAIIRIIYYVVGVDIIKGTWVHYTWIILILITILLGSFMACVQKNLKKRLAFSSVSQISYALLGVSLLNTTALQGAYMQVASHAVIKVGLFLVAGVLIHVLNIHNVDELDGVGKKMPITMWCYTICALGLIGVPPTSGFVSKWYLASGALSSGLKVIDIVAPIVLIISAILTAYYLLDCTIRAFFPSNKDNSYKRIKEPLLFVVPLLIFATLSILIGLFASPLINLIASYL
ncbi:MAG: complex I subunit 5 family protein [Bacilli bacterium]